MKGEKHVWVVKVRLIAKEWDVNLAVIERLAGWNVNGLSTAMNQGNMPAADRGLRLERALGLRLGWLFDDSAEPWPPPKNQLSNDLALEDPRLAQAIDGRLSTVLRLAADSIGSAPNGSSEEPVGVCFLDRDFRYRFINQALAKHNGRSVEYHLGKTLKKVIPKIWPGIKEQLEGVLKTGKPVINGHVKGKTPARPGENRVFEHSFHADENQGKRDGVWCAVQDVTERHSEEYLRSHDRRYHELIDAVPHPIEECDLKGRITFCSPASERLKGYKAGKLRGKYIWACSVTETAAAKLREELEWLIEEQPEPPLKPWLGQIKSQNKSIIDVRVDWNYRRAAGGELIGFVSMITNLTARRRADALLEGIKESHLGGTIVFGSRWHDRSGAGLATRN